MKIVRTFSRILVGLVFMFSGFVKGVDPLGTAYRMTDYMEVLKLHSLIPFALTLSILLCAAEFILGVLLVTNVKIKIVSWFTLLFMSFFTIVTFFDATKNLVKDCGCFGDAVKLTNWQTFYKNIVLMIFTLIIVFGRNKIKPWLKNKTEYIVIVTASILFIWFSVYNYRNLPMLNFRPWKEGNKMLPDNPKPIKYYIAYKNKKTGEKKEWESSKIPYQDTTFAINWAYDTTRIDNPNVSLLNGFAILDTSSADMTEHFVKNPEFQFLLAVYDVNKANKKVFEKINQFYAKAKAKNISFIILTSSPKEDVAKFKKEINDPGYEYYFSDDTSLKAMIRSNPGLVLLKKAVVLGQWHWRNIPEFDNLDLQKLEKKYIK